MNIFMTGATGYIGGSVAAAMMAAGHEVSGLVRSDARADQARDHGIAPVFGSLDDADVLAESAAEADAVINCASSDHRGAAEAMLAALEGSQKPFLHTSGSSIVGHADGGEAVDDVFDEASPLNPSLGRAARAALNDDILAWADRGVRAVILCPSLIYGLGRGAAEHSMQVPWLIELAEKYGIARHIGPGANIWSNVHIDDLVGLFGLALESAPAGGFYFAENGENSMREVCEAINAMMGIGLFPESMTLEEASAEWGENAAHNTMGSNSRVRAKRAREELGWSPGAPSLLDEIMTGCYADG